MPKRDEFGIPDLAAAIVRFVQDNLPGQHPLSVTIHLLHDQRFSMPVVHIPPRACDDCTNRNGRNGTSH